MAAINRQVFINCPLDHDYYPLLEAVAFAVCVCGYTPRFPSERVESGLNRLSKIVGLIDECDFSLHDISRTELNSNQLPRFNMPFELGLALGRKYSISDGGAAGLLILDREPFRYHESFSDISGCDPLAHYDSPQIAMHRVWKWLVSHDDAHPVNRDRLVQGIPVKLQSWLEMFQADMLEVRGRFEGELDDLPLSGLVFSIRVWLEANTEALS